jgi:hypothetical protein
MQVDSSMASYDPLADFTPMAMLADHRSRPRRLVGRRNDSL